MDRPVQGEAGFTLVEVLAALAVFSIAALGLVRVSAENARTAQVLQTRAVAEIVADNALAYVLADPGQLDRATTRDTVRMAGRDWLVEQRVTETGTNGLVQIQVGVAPDPGPRARPGAPIVPVVQRAAFKQVPG